MRDSFRIYWDSQYEITTGVLPAMTGVWSTISLAGFDRSRTFKFEYAKIIKYEFMFPKYELEQGKNVFSTR